MCRRSCGRSTFLDPVEAEHRVDRRVTPLSTVAQRSPAQHARHQRFDCINVAPAGESVCVPPDWLALLLKHARCNLHGSPIADPDQAFERAQAMKVITGASELEQQRRGRRVGQFTEACQQTVDDIGIIFRLKAVE